MPFSGDAVAVYGTVSPDHANIEVQVDGQSKTFAGGAGGMASVLHTKVLSMHYFIMSMTQTRVFFPDVIGMFSRAFPDLKYLLSTDSTLQTISDLETITSPSPLSLRTELGLS